MERPRSSCLGVVARMQRVDSTRCSLLGMQNSVFMDVFIRTTYSSLTVNVTVTNLSPASVQLTYAFLFITHQSTIYSARSSTGLGGFNFLSFLIRVSYHVFFSFFLFLPLFFSTDRKLRYRYYRCCESFIATLIAVFQRIFFFFLRDSRSSFRSKRTFSLPLFWIFQFAASELVVFENYSVVFNSQVFYSSDIVNFNNKRRWTLGLEQSGSWLSICQVNFPRSIVRCSIIL